MGIYIYLKAAVLNLLGINDAGDGLEINDEGDLLLY